MVLAAKSDGKIQPEEKEFIKYFEKTFPVLQKISNEEKIEALSIIKSMGTDDIIDKFSSEMSQNEKDIAYAFAAEVCAMNFEMPVSETSYLELLEKKFNISAKTKDFLEQSMKLRYGV
tara:strand:+ start:85 stop:438 length:354 start_codon:yes stop_codon:yes gene_type:complete